MRSPHTRDVWKKKPSAGLRKCVGINAEQFRIWEALEVGALPVILAEEQHNNLEQIGLRLPKVRGSICSLHPFGSPPTAHALPMTPGLAHGFQ